jgi:hypothetical protein
MEMAPISEDFPSSNRRKSAPNVEKTYPDRTGSREKRGETSPPPGTGDPPIRP